MKKLNISPKLERFIVEKMDEHILHDSLPECYDYLDPPIEPIEHNGYDGFMPFTNGGFKLSVMNDLMSVWASGAYPQNEEIEKQIRRTIDDSLDMAKSDFCNENKTELLKYYSEKEIDENSENIHYGDLYEKDASDLAEKLSLTEDEYLREGAEFWYQFRIQYYSADNHRNDTGKDELFFIAGVNLDYTYGRDSGLEQTYATTVPLQGLTKKHIEEIIINMAQSI